ncbi:dynein axonemal assembly factor 8-like [Gastrophryne carolinensis]
MGGDLGVDDLAPCLPWNEDIAKRRQDRIMEKLVELSVKQSQAWAPQVCREKEKAESNQNPERPAVLQSGIKVRSEDLPTVYLDLRATSWKKAAESRSQPQRPKGDTLLTNDLETTGKSMLLHQLRYTKATASPESLVQPPPAKKHKQKKRISALQSPNLQQLEKVAGARKPTLQSQEQHGRVTKQVMKEGCGVSEQEVKNKEQGCGTEQDMKEKEHCVTKQDMKQEESSRSTGQAEMIHREKLEKQRKSRQRMQAQLEQMKPQKSVNGRQPMAEQTPILFHPEASYSPEMNVLPVCSDGEKLLLTVRLSSCGQAITPTKHKGQFPFCVLSQANVYHALLVWFISLVSPFGLPTEADIPFQVMGLQQVWREEGLALYACVSPSPRHVAANAGPKVRKYKSNENLRGTSSFYQQVSWFLSQHTLQSIAFWTEELAHQLQDQLFPLNPDVPAVRLSSIIGLNPDPQAVKKVFSSSPGLFWITLETEGKLSHLPPDLFRDSDTEVVAATLFDTLLRHPAAFHHALHLILTAGLDVCGLRLLYPQASALQSYFGRDLIPTSYAGGDVQLPPVLILALRGPHALELWGGISGPRDPALAHLTDQNSLSAIYGQTKANSLLHYSRTPGYILRDLSLWFGGRILNNGNMDIGIQNPQRRRTQSTTESHPTGQTRCTSRPPALLTATTMGDILLLVSPAIPPYAYGDVLHTCCRRGFHIHGIRRLRLSAKRAAMLNMSSMQLPVFCPSKPLIEPDGEPRPGLDPPLHCLLLLLRRENAAHHTAALLQGLLNGLVEQGLLGAIRANLSSPADLDTTLCFHAAPYSDTLLQGLGGSLHCVPEPITVKLDLLSRQPFPLDPEDEQVVILTMSGSYILRTAGHLLRQILRPPPRKDTVVAGCLFEGFEVLGLKWLPCLSRLQAKEITPYEVGERHWQPSIEQLTSHPALVCALRHLHAFTALADAIQQFVPIDNRRPQFQLIMSTTPETAFRQAALIFTERDLVSDAQSRRVLKYTAPPRIHRSARCGENQRGQAESIFTYMLAGPPLLYTVLIVKPGCWRRNLGKMLSRLHMNRFALVGLKLVTLSREDALQITPAKPKQDNSSCQAHCDYLMSAPCLVLCLQRINAVLKLLYLLGPEDPHVCKDEDQFLWRAQYGTSTLHNAVYGSTSYQAAIQDIKRFFPEGLVCDHQSPVLKGEKISTLTHDDVLRSDAQRRTTKNQTCQLGPSLHIDSPFTSALCQTTCLLFPAPALQGASPAYIQGLEHLIHREFFVTGVRLTVFDQSQAEMVAALYGANNSSSVQSRAVMEGPCLLIAAQRDNAVTCFHSLMGSVNGQNRPSVPQAALCAQSQSQASDILSCLFESLTPDSIHRIEIVFHWICIDDGTHGSKQKAK